MLIITKSSYASGVRKLAQLDPLHTVSSGMVGQLYLRSSGNYVIGVSDGSNPCGIIGSIFFGSAFYWEWLHGTIDKYDHSCVFKTGDALFSNALGELTSTSNATNLSLGVVIQAPSNSHPFLEFVYFGVQKETISTINTAPIGMTCCLCKTINEYAVANQPDGSYKCYGCRI